jgi:hypothetical protein
MERREFVTSMLAGAATAVTLSGSTLQAQSVPSPHFYQLRKYTLRTGPQLALTEKFFEEALIPALNRREISPVGAFKLDVGPDTPTYYLLLPSNSGEALLTADLRLAQDAKFLVAAQPFWAAPASAPAFLRVESSILSAFSGWPKVVAPKLEKRMFQLRTYESASYAAHLKKVQMFNEAEISIFKKTGLSPVFFGSTVSGSHIPSLTYMLTFPDIETLTRNWSIFGSDPAWKELSHRPEYADAEIVSNISNLYLSPLNCSQI